MNQPYQQFDPVRSQTAEPSVKSSIQTSSGVDLKTIEMLKVARNQVMQATPIKKSEFSNGAGKSMNENTNINREQNSNPKQAHNKLAPLEINNKVPKEQQLSKNIADKFLTGFAEEFIQKLTSIEQEKAAVDEEMSKVENLWSSLIEKKKQLKVRIDELTNVKDKLQELDKEMNKVLKSK